MACRYLFVKGNWTASAHKAKAAFAKACTRTLCTSPGKKFAPRKRPSSLLDKVMRVDHAGEVGANRIYAGQMAVLGDSDIGPVIQEMWDQEKKHVETFNHLLPKYRVRPTLLMPLWNVAGFVLAFDHLKRVFWGDTVEIITFGLYGGMTGYRGYAGAGSALLGKEAAMACTIAVEEVIGEHYDNQLRELLNEDPENNQEILSVIQKFRDEELEHLQTGVDHEGEKVSFYPSFKQVIQGGCKAAIFLSERI